MQKTDLNDLKKLFKETDQYEKLFKQINEEQKQERATERNNRWKDKRNKSKVPSNRISENVNGLTMRKEEKTNSYPNMTLTPPIKDDHKPLDRSSHNEKLDRTSLGSMNGTETQGSQVFGASLEDLMPSVTLIPKILTSCFNNLVKNNADKHEGIFKNETDQKILIQTKNMINLTQDTSIIDKSKDVDMIAHLLISWVRELKEPICGEIKKFFIDAEEIEDEQLFLNYIHTLIHSLSARNFTVLRFIAHLLYTVYQSISINKLTESDIANLWGPIMLGETPGDKKKDVLTAKVLYNFQKNVNDKNQIDVQVGQVVDVLKQTDTGWALVTFNSLSGYVPTAYLSFNPKVVDGSKFVTALFKHFEFIFENQHKDIKFSYKDSKLPNTIRVTSGSLDAIFYKLIEQYFVKLIDPQFQDVFLLTHSYFLSDEKFLSKFISLYLQYTGPQKWKETVRLRVLELLKRWFELFGVEINPELQQQWENFSKKISENNTRLTTIVDSLKLTTQKQISSFRDSEKLSERDSKKVPPPPHNKHHSLEFNLNSDKILSSATLLSEPSPRNTDKVFHINYTTIDLLKSEKDFFSISDFGVPRFANMLTYWAHSLFASISSQECLHKNFEKESKAPFFISMINQFTFLQLWTSLYVIRRKTKEQRARSIEQVLSVISHLLNLKNFQCCYALYAGLAHSSVNRLQSTWKQVSSSNMKEFAVYKDLFNPTKNYKNYSKELSQSPTPLVPWIGLYNSYLVAIEENVDKLDNGHFNFHKLRMLHVLLQEFKKYQRKYTLEDTPKLLQLQLIFSTVPVLKEIDLYTFSSEQEQKKKK